MKKIISAIIAAAMALSAAASVAAADDTPKVYVDDTLINFSDQQPVIVEDRTLVPARGVFEAMGMDVNWEESTQTVRIDSKGNVIRIFLTIDDSVMSVYTATGIITSDKKEVTLDVPPQILQDRTMIPLRAISEALNCVVDWDDATSTVYIKTENADEAESAATGAPSATADPTATEAPSATAEPAATEAPSATADPAATEAPSATADPTATEAPEATKAPAPAGKTEMSLSTDVQSVSAGDTVDIYVNIKNFPQDAFLSGVTALVSYSKADFEYSGISFLALGDENAAGLAESNPDYTDNAVKAITITLDESMKSDGPVAKLTFKALTSRGGEFALVNSYTTGIGFDNMFTFTSSDGEKVYNLSGNELDLNTTPVKVAGK